VGEHTADSASDDAAVGVVPWAQPWGTIGEPPPPDRKLLMAQHRLNMLRKRSGQLEPSCAAAYPAESVGMTRVCSGGSWWAQSDTIAEVTRQLAQNSFAFVDGFQGAAAAEQLRMQVVEMHRAGLLGGGRVLGLPDGAAPSDRVRGLLDEQAAGAAASETPLAPAGGGAALSGVSAGFIRGDQIAWMNVPRRRQLPAADVDPLSRYTWLLDEFVTLLSAADDGSVPGGLKGVRRRSEAMVTCYPHGARYMRHTDNSCKNGNGRRCNGRRLTAIGYFNRPRPEGNGAVRLFASGDALTSPPRIDVQPELDRVLLFYSDERTPHEVLPSTDSPRYAVTVWFYDQEEAPTLQNNMTLIAAEVD
jgi:Rps23 Pro-64 3,4-dihydroxylase Tpa1-like proline 4-hydroxylase